MELTYTDANHVRQGIKRSFSLDLSFGVNDNDFTIKLAAGDSLPLHGLVYIDGTEYGGVIDQFGIDNSGDVSLVTYSGRTWHGILANKVIVPSGDYYTMSGEANKAIGSLISYLGLEDIFTTRSKASDFTLNYQVARFSDAYSALRNALASVGARLNIERKNGQTVLSAQPIENIIDNGDNALGYNANDNTRPVNHLVCAGEGELSQRTVVHLYADAEGNISQKQTFFGIDEVAQLYDYTSADETQLIDDGKKKFKELLQTAQTVEMNTPTDLGLHIGDIVGFDSRSYGLSVSSNITQITVTVGTSNIPTISYEIGDINSSNYRAT